MKFFLYNFILILLLPLIISRLIIRSLKDRDYIKNISNRYLSNLKVINGICNEFKIKCIFIWQPNIHTVNPQKLSKKEEQIVKSDFWGKPYKKLTQIVFQDARTKNLNIYEKY